MSEIYNILIKYKKGIYGMKDFEKRKYRGVTL